MRTYRFLTWILITLILGISVPALADERPESLESWRPLIPSAFPMRNGDVQLWFDYLQFQEDNPFSSGKYETKNWRIDWQAQADVRIWLAHHSSELPANIVVQNPMLSGYHDYDSMSYGAQISLGSEGKRVPRGHKQAGGQFPTAFAVGYQAEELTMNRPGLTENGSIHLGYLNYSSQIDSRLTLHTILGLGKFSTGFTSGEISRVGLGADFLLRDDPGYQVYLVTDAIMDMYTYRRPTFGTVRVAQLRNDLVFQYEKGALAYYGVTLWSETGGRRNSTEWHYGSVLSTKDLFAPDKAAPPPPPKEEPKKEEVKPAEQPKEQPKSEQPPTAEEKKPEPPAPAAEPKTDEKPKVEEKKEEPKPPADKPADKK